MFPQACGGPPGCGKQLLQLVVAEPYLEGLRLEELQRAQSASPRLGYAAEPLHHPPGDSIREILSW